MPNTIDQNAEIEKELAELAQSPIQQLRQRWRACVSGPNRLRRSVLTCFAAALRKEFKNNITAGYPLPHRRNSTRSLKRWRASRAAGLNCPDGSSPARSWFVHGRTNRIA